MPRRRCVGCGRIAPKSELLRIAGVADGDGRRARAVIDARARMPGRGAYLCRGAAHRGEPPRPDEQCLARALERRAVARALRRPVAGDLVPGDVKLVESSSR
ncbi:MAG TPA: YlxR family protein [Solirubrobacteraceae bacterium]|nr:YlxR family protein [Solirubrobacteraceae bacterium]